MSEPIAIIRKNAVEEIRLAFNEYNGHQLLDLRVYTEYRTTGEIGPTKKGFSVRIEQLPELMAALQKAEDEARTEGLL